MRTENQPLDLAIWKLPVTLTRTFWWTDGAESLTGVGSSDNERAGNGDNEYDKVLNEFTIKGEEKWSQS